MDDYDSIEALQGGDASVNARITTDVLTGKDGACRRIVLLNAALAIMAADKAETLREGIGIAAGAIDGGAAWRKLQALIELTNR